MKKTPGFVAATVVGALALVGCGDEAKSSPACGTTTGSICTWAGIGEPAFDGDGKDKRASALYWPIDVEFAPDGRSYLVDWQNHRIRRANADGKLETVVGTDFIGDGPDDLGDLTPTGSPGTKINLNHPTDIQIAADGTVYVMAWHNHKIRTFDPATGTVRVLIGRGGGFVGDGGPAGDPAARVNQPKGLAIAPGTGDIYFTDNRNHRIRKIAADDTRTLSTVAGNGKPGFSGDGGPLLDASLNLQTGVENPEPGGAIAIDASGKLYVADTINHSVRQIDPAAGTITTIAGTGAKGFSGDGGPATQAQFAYPRDLEIGPVDGRLYVADTDNHRIRAVDLTTGVVTTVVGTGVRGFSGDGGQAATAEIARPFGVAFDAEGNMYISDTFNNRIRRVAK